MHKVLLDFVDDVISAAAIYSKEITIIEISYYKIPIKS